MIFQPNIVELRQFYSSELGRLLRRDIGRGINNHWGHIPDGSKIAGLGFAVPYLHPYLQRNLDICAVMFAHLGAMYWPTGELNHSMVAHESGLPFEDDTMDYVLLAHGAEHSLHLNSLLSEAFRCLKPSGKLLIIAPNRHGWWQVRTDNPFGVGSSFHGVQLRHRAELAGLTFVKQSSALFYPPARGCVMRKLSIWIEYMGLMIAPNWGGALLVEFEKQLYAGIPVAKKHLFMGGCSSLQPQAN